MKDKNKKWRIYGLFAVMLLAAYFINVEVQSYLGRRALTQSGLELHELEDAFPKARAESKLVLADLSAIWCPSCRTLDQKVFSDPNVKRAIHERFIFARVEYESEQGKAFQKKYNLSGFPNLLVLDPDGRVVKHLKVVFEPTQFLAQLETP